ncbi:MAG TPA: hypothetical protein PKA28_11415 [Methylomusa anaerophila]|uniref:Bacterial extracellular solute-binding protein n=1 Tax=Methylomusa anaerophila TaxID=1930071 RepID=A0A348AJB7_9FIRM|nr:hypothetical protein [Methylomusa anaerophila]BBB91165.1 hypothetical protein MAMMFC1_01836 [Methylomusa anaerophila]HML89042.1 hypothetical protein [Methylomusa anaerophila]
MNKPVILRLLGIAILVAVIISGVLIKNNMTEGPGRENRLAAVQATQIKGFIGGEKAAFFEDEAVKAALLKRGIAVDYKTAGSLEMLNSDYLSNSDFIFPGSQNILEMYKKAYGNGENEIIFNSPLVIYTWDNIVDALVKRGIAHNIDGTYFAVDFAKLIDLALAGSQWPDIGVPDLYGKIIITSTDPLKSNSGNEFFALMANVLAGDVINMDSLNTVLPKLKEYYARVGYMENTSSVLFEQYLKTGKPMIIGYENQLIEFAVQNPDVWNKAKSKVRVLYPVPTIWSSHPLIVIKPNARQLLKALTDTELSKLAWERHGFRTGLGWIEADANKLDGLGIPDRIDKIVPLPKPEVMDTLINNLK